MYEQMAAILSFTLMIYAPGIDLDIELGQIRYSQDALLKQRPQGGKTTVFNPNTTHKRVFTAVTQSYSVVQHQLINQQCPAQNKKPRQPHFPSSPVSQLTQLQSQDLARIRNNQQRCRQRKRDYVTELEAKIAEYESSSERKVATLQASIDELRMENERLRRLLGDVDARGEGRGAEGIATAATEIGAGGSMRSDAGIPEEASQTRTIFMSKIHPRSGLGGNGAELSPGAALSQPSKVSSACLDYSAL